MVAGIGARAAICVDQAAALAGRGPFCARHMRPAQFKRSAQDPRALSAEICDQKNCDWRGNFWGRRGIIPPAVVATGRDGTCGGYWYGRGDYFGRGSFFGRRFSQIGPADRARIFLSFFALFDADGDHGLLRGGRIGAD